MALENARYHERNLEWTRVQRDLEAARLIQRSLLPQTDAADSGLLDRRPLDCVL